MFSSLQPDTDLRPFIALLKSLHEGILDVAFFPTGPSSPETAEGSTLDVNAEGGTVTVGSDGATVVQADVEASNGVIHAIDKVLIPPTVTLG